MSDPEQAWFAGSSENTAIAQGSPDGTVRYRGNPTFTPEHARLFAAAPELLAACWRAVGYFCALVIAGEVNGADDVIEELIAAISKADGK